MKRLLYALAVLFAAILIAMVLNGCAGGKTITPRPGESGKTYHARVQREYAFDTWQKANRDWGLKAAKDNLREAKRAAKEREKKAGYLRKIEEINAQAREYHKNP